MAHKGMKGKKAEPVSKKTKPTPVPPRKGGKKKLFG